MSHPGKGVVVAAAMVALGAPASAQPAPSTEGGRYSFVPVREGLIRLDVRTGEVSTCVGSDTGWTCRATPDEKAAFETEIARLRAEVDTLKADLAARAASSGADRAEAARAEAAKAEATKAEAAKAEAARADAAKAEAARAEALAKSEAARAELARAEAVKAESARAEAMARAEAAKLEAAKAEAARAEAVARTETARAEIARAEAIKAEAIKAEAERAMAESRKAEAEKAEAEKARAAAGSAAAKADPPRTITLALPEEATAQVAASLSRAWREFVDTVQRWQRDLLGRG